MRLFHSRCVEELPLPHRIQLFGERLDIEYDCLNRSLHVWVGPAGIHLFWPAIWKSRPDWCSNWREPIA